MHFIVLSSEPGLLPAVGRVRINATGDWSLSSVKSRLANEIISGPGY